MITWQNPLLPSTSVWKALTQDVWSRCILDFITWNCQHPCFFPISRDSRRILCSYRLALFSPCLPARRESKCINQPSAHNSMSTICVCIFMRARSYHRVFLNGNRPPLPDSALTRRQISEKKVLNNSDQPLSIGKTCFERGWCYLYSSKSWIHTNGWNKVSHRRLNSSIRFDKSIFHGASGGDATWDDSESFEGRNLPPSYILQGVEKLKVTAIRQSVIRAD